MVSGTIWEEPIGYLLLIVRPILIKSLVTAKYIAQNVRNVISRKSSTACKVNGAGFERRDSAVLLERRVGLEPVFIIAPR